MEQNLWAIRLKSIAWTIGGVALTAVAGFLLSQDFANLLMEYTGSATLATIIALLVTEGMKHLRNKGVMKAASMEDKFAGSSPNVTLI